MAEIAPFGVLFMGTAGQQCDTHVRNGRARQHAGYRLLCKLRKDQPLPIAVEHILAARAGICDPRAASGRLQQQMDLRVMAQRLKVPRAAHRLFDCLAVNDTAFSKGHVKPKAFQNPAL